MYRAVAAATAGKGETRLTDETRDADDVGAEALKRALGTPPKPKRLKPKEEKAQEKGGND